MPAMPQTSRSERGRRRLALTCISCFFLSVVGHACGGETTPPPAPAATPRAPAQPAAATPAAPPPASAEEPRTEQDPTLPPARLPAAARIVAIGDLHGDLAATKAALRLAGAIDADDRWSGGDLIVVQTGDQLDRGDDERAILDLLDRLRAEATAAGGAMHVLNGNHELMNVAGDLRYVTAGGFLEFEDLPGLDLTSPAAQNVPSSARARFVAFAPGGPYARRLAQRNVIQVIGDNVFVHGGVLPQHVRYGLERINREVAAWLRGEGPVPVEIALDDQSPVWTRAYSDAPGLDDCRLLQEALAMIPAKRMIVGHTVHKEGITSACDGAVWMVDVGMAAYYGGRPQVLELAQGAPPTPRGP